MADFNPAFLGPTTRPIWNQLCARLADLGTDTRAWLDYDPLVDTIVDELDANPRTVATVIDNGRRFGLLNGAKRIRPTTLGRAWLHANGHHGAHGT